MPSNSYARLCDHVREIALVQSIESLLEWDERTGMPAAAGPYRAEQMSHLAGRVHQLWTDPRMADWLAELKGRIHTAQQRVALAVNRELVLLYWQLGQDILARQAAQGWGAKVIDRLAHDLRAAFPDMKGFSPRNLKYMRAFAEAWPDAEFVQEVLAQLPWGHNLVLLDRLALVSRLPVSTCLVTQKVTQLLGGLQ